MLDERQRALLGVLARKDGRLEIGLELPGRSPAIVEGDPHEPLGGRDTERAVGGDPFGQRHGLVEDATGRDDHVHDADGGGPVGAISMATASGTRRPSWAPPPAANSPRFTSGRPKNALSEATTMSQASNSSNPPATAVAFAAPMSGLAMPSRMNRM